MSNGKKENSMDGNISTRLVEALHAQEMQRPRSLQAKIGPSEIGGCHAKVWHKVNGTEPTNPDTLRLAAIMGTAIHATIEKAFRRLDPFSERYLLEMEAEVDGVPGHIDCYDQQEQMVIDWKTTTKKNASYFPSKQQIMQVQVYGYLLSNCVAPFPVDRVGLVAIMRDGNEDDVVEWSADYDEAIALEGLAWLREVRAAEVPVPQKDAVFCRSYCEFFGACPGKAAAAADEVTITAVDEVAAVEAYLLAKRAADVADGQVAAAREALVGVSGRTGTGVLVSWSERTSSSVDRAAVEAAMGEVPMKAGRPSQVLNVKQPKGGE